MLHQLMEDFGFEQKAVPGGAGAGVEEGVRSEVVAVRVDVLVVHLVVAVGGGVPGQAPDVDAKRQLSKSSYRLFYQSGLDKRTSCRYCR